MLVQEEPVEGSAEDAHGDDGTQVGSPVDGFLRRTVAIGWTDATLAAVAPCHIGFQVGLTVGAALDDMRHGFVLPGGPFISHGRRRCLWNPHPGDRQLRGGSQ